MQVLRTILPPAVPVPTSFECAGHIAHLNLLDVHLPYRHIIAQVLSSGLSHSRRRLETCLLTVAIEALLKSFSSSFEPNGLQLFVANHKA